ncbi:hypothetical protein C3L33_18841, partial [Rhododendron williamsianum]
MSFSGVGSTRCEEAMQVEDDIISDDMGSEQIAGERKKIRLSMEQVKALEKSFELLVLKGIESSGNGPINLKKETEVSWSNGSDKHKIFHSSNGTHLPQNSSRSSSENIQFQKFDQTVTDESLCNMFMGGIAGDQSGFWPWPEQQHLH